MGFGIVLFLLFGYLVYLTFLIMNGHINLGLNFIPFLDIYPLETDNTFVSGFLFNAWVVSLTNYALINQLCNIYSTFGKNSNINTSYKGVVENSNLFHWASTTHFFQYLSFGMFFVVIVLYVLLIFFKKIFSSLCCCCRKKENEELRKDLGKELVDLKTAKKEN